MGLVNTAILAGFAALAIPVAIHLLRSRRFQATPLGSLRFLKLTVRENVRWRRLRDLLLLLARLAILALLTLLFARPYLRKPAEEPAGRVEAIVLLDVSGSTSGRSLGVRNIELGVAAARRVVSDLPAASKVTVAAFADTVREVPDLAHAELAAAGRTDYRQALEWARDRLALSECKQRRVVLVTDLQAAGLPDRAVANWPLDVGVTVVPVAAPGAWNAGLAAVRNLAPYLGHGGEGRLEVDLACSGAMPGDAITVVLEIEGQPPRQVQVQPRSGHVELGWVPGVPGLYRGVVRIDAADAYPDDNVRHFAVAVRLPQRVLLVNGAPGRTPYEDETYFLEKALTVPPRPGVPAAFAVEVCRELGDLKGIAAVALCNVSELSSGEVQRLAAFTGAGGGLAWFLGDQTEPEWCERLQTGQLFPGALARLAVPVPRQFIVWDTEHPALALFNARAKGDLGRIIFRDAFELTPAPAARVLARLANDTVAICECACGKGRVMVVVNPCDRDWTNWPTERVFLPLMQELFAYLAGARADGRTPEEKSTGLSEPRAPGVYGATPPVVVNPDPGEMDVSTSEEPAFRNVLGIGPAPADLVDAGGGDAGQPAKRVRENEIWVYLASGLLMVMFLENALADRGRV
ncbi:MAG: hypothetical protein A3K18_08600 [Lentisphaerae bacterium RIFOXYA12_64_32]|nr:MAG: hypothetical protein A3K18_08600 [Lentisphaerae bacterium RIFOXYA12_64_32]